MHLITLLQQEHHSCSTALTLTFPFSNCLQMCGLEMKAATGCKKQLKEFHVANGTTEGGVKLFQWCNFALSQHEVTHLIPQIVEGNGVFMFGISLEIRNFLKLSPPSDGTNWGYFI